MQGVGSEYRALLAQLATMRQLCDKLKHNNLRRDLDTLQSSLNKYERTSKGLFFWDTLYSQMVLYYFWSGQKTIHNCDNSLTTVIRLIVGGN